MKDKNIIIINGIATSGKDTFCKLCSNYKSTYVISTVDKIKEVYSILGWDGEKTESHRKALSDIKDIATKNLDHPYIYIQNQISSFLNSSYELMFIHSREPDEIKRFVNDYNCISLLISNPNIKKIISNHADARVEDYDYDYVINNEGTIEELKEKAQKFIENIFS